MNKQTRIVSNIFGEDQYLYFQIQKEDGEWVTVGSTGVVTTKSIWTKALRLVDGSPSLEWDSGSGKLFREVVPAKKIDCEEEKFVLYGEKDCHNIRQEFTVQEDGRIHVEVTNQISDGYSELKLSKMMNSIYFCPYEKVKRNYEILDFAWIPNIHKSANHVCADHCFRSPITGVAADGFYIAIVPDLDIFREHRTIRQAMDLRTLADVAEAPCLSYGICHWEAEPHMYAKHEPNMLQTVDTPNLKYGFDILIGMYTDRSELTKIFTKYLWDRYGKQFMNDIRPQVMPFEEYGRRYTYRYELPSSINSFTSDGKEYVGIHNIGRHGANFHAWENDLMVNYGIQHYAEKWDDAELKRISKGITNLYKFLPRKQGAFPCVYNFDEQKCEGTLHWTARSADPINGYDSAAMSSAVWWSLNRYEDQDKDPEILSLAKQYADFLISVQKDNGALPTYFWQDLTTVRQLEESGTSALNAAVLARVARLTGIEKYKEAALKAGKFAFHLMVEKSEFFDFEAFYSCTPQPLHAIDYWTGIKPQCTLSILWGSKMFLELYRLTKDNFWMQYGEYLMRYLCLYQQVWDPSFYPEYLFGGFYVINTDGEWNDRQQKVAPTLVNYYLETGDKEYLERAVAGCRASFALMDMEENHANHISDMHLGQEIRRGNSGRGKSEPGQGYASENIHHYLDVTGSWPWTGMTFSAGGGLAASAYLEKHVGNVCVDLRQNFALGIDGVQAELISADKPEITVTNPLKDLPMPYCESRRLTVRVFADKEVKSLIVNGTEAEYLGENRFAFTI